MDTKELRELILTELCNIAPEIEKDEVPDDQDFREALELDSMDFLSLVIAVSQKTKVNIPEVDYPKVLTLNDMIDYINNN